MKSHFLYILLFTLLSISSLSGQAFISDSTNRKTLLWTATVSGGLNNNQHNASFSGLPGVPSCCPNYSGGSGTGLNIGAKFSIPVNRIMFAEMRLGFSNLNGTMAALQTQTIDDNGVATGVFEHKIDTRISILTFEPTASFVLFNSLQCYGGLSLGAVTSATYTQTETLLSPSDVVFENDSRVRNRFSDKISQVPVLQAGLTAGLTYTIPLSNDGSFCATPEIAYTLGLTNVVSTGDSWKINTLRIGLGISYNFLKSPPLGTTIQQDSPSENRLPTKR